MAKWAGLRSDMLSARKVETERRPGLYGDSGLYLKVGDFGSKSYSVGELVAMRKLGLGPLHAMSLAHARAEAIRKATRRH